MPKRPAASPVVADDVDAAPKSKARRASKRVVDTDAHDADDNQETPLTAKDSASKKKKKTTATAAVSHA